MPRKPATMTTTPSAVAPQTPAPVPVAPWRVSYPSDETPLPPCPFTGKQLTERQTKDQYGATLYAASGDFFFTRYFPTRRQLFFHLAHRDGSPPAFTALATTSVKVLEPPHANAFQDVVDKGKKIDEVAKHVVSERAAELGLKK